MDALQKLKAHASNSRGINHSALLSIPYITLYYYVNLITTFIYLFIYFHKKTYLFIYVGSLVTGINWSVTPLNDEQHQEEAEEEANVQEDWLFMVYGLEGKKARKG